MSQQKKGSTGTSNDVVREGGVPLSLGYDGEAPGWVLAAFV
jgi:hypothetical protein